MHTVRDPRVHRRSTGQDNIRVQVAADVQVALGDGIVRRLVDAGGLKPKERGLEECLRCAEPRRSSSSIHGKAKNSARVHLPFITNSYNLAIRELIAFL